MLESFGHQTLVQNSLLLSPQKATVVAKDRHTWFCCLSCIKLNTNHKKILTIVCIALNGLFQGTYDNEASNILLFTWQDHFLTKAFKNSTWHKSSKKEKKKKAVPAVIKPWLGGHQCWDQRCSHIQCNLHQFFITLRKDGVTYDNIDLIISQCFYYY